MSANPGSDIIEFGRSILHDEARALDALAVGLGEDFDKAIELILGSTGKLIVCGLGKSGHDSLELIKHYRGWDAQLALAA